MAYEIIVHNLAKTMQFPSFNVDKAFYFTYYSRPSFHR